MKANNDQSNKYNGGSSYSCSSYCELLTKLIESVNFDQFMPKKDKDAALEAIFKVNTLLWKYSC